ncbi:MAG: TA system VapC family ribonuclease toxin [Bryobacteraceae bacterium]
MFTKAAGVSRLIAVDTNILVYSVREDSPFHKQASACVRALAEGAAPWAIPWPCLHEFVAVVTHPKIYRPPTAVVDALRQVEFWLESPSLRTLGESSEGGGLHYWKHLRAVAETGAIAGARVHDARIAAICRACGVREIWSADRDFSRIPGLLVRNPLA